MRRNRSARSGESRVRRGVDRFLTPALASGRDFVSLLSSAQPNGGRRNVNVATAWSRPAALPVLTRRRTRDLRRSTAMREGASRGRYLTRLRTGEHGPLPATEGTASHWHAANYVARRLPMPGLTVQSVRRGGSSCATRRRAFPFACSMAGGGVGEPLVMGVSASDLPARVPRLRAPSLESRSLFRPIWEE